VGKDREESIERPATTNRAAAVHTEWNVEGMVETTSRLTAWVAGT